MTASELLQLLAWCPGAFDIVIKGRGNRAMLSLTTLEDARLPEGWRLTNEPSFQRLAGHKRVIYDPKGK